MKQLLSLILFLPIFLSAQSDTTKGINWTTGLSWDQVKAKAKAENKYIFIDAYATWCKPCKLMDKNVYTVDSVAELFNKKFISVKVQMDKTEKDTESIKGWYADADSIKKQYHVEGYPTLLFFNPAGQVTDKQIGYKSVNEFVSLGKSATAPGKIYDDPYADYNRKLAAYKQGERNYNNYPSMIIMADKIGDTAISRQLTKEFTDYASNLPPKERYTKERIEFWNNYTWLSITRVFSFFYKDAKLINQVMNKKGYAESFVDKVVQYEIAVPFMKEQANGSGVAMTGAYLSYVGTEKKIKVDYSEANWNKLDSLIGVRFGKNYAKRNVLIARIEWYARHMNESAVIEYSLKLFSNYPPDFNDFSTSYKINGPAWDAFLTSTDKTILKGYAKWMKKVVRYYPEDNYIDTYANLLYKLGRRKKSIEWEKRAVELSPKDESLKMTLQQMKRGEPTYVHKGAIWNN